MINRILTGWTFVRAIYLLLGSMVIFQSAVAKQWAGVIFGAYFASMGLFAYGCAAGNCFGGKCTTDPEQFSKNRMDDKSLPYMQHHNEKTGPSA
jgi:hypothetical protein